MDYKNNDILECIELFSINCGNARVICKGDFYKIKYIRNKKLYIKEIPINKNIVYADIIPIEVKQIETYFRCKRVDRLRKLKKLNEKPFLKLIKIKK